LGLGRLDDARTHFDLAIAQSPEGRHAAGRGRRGRRPARRSQGSRAAAGEGPQARSGQCRRLVQSRLRWRARGTCWSAPCGCSARPWPSTRNTPTPPSAWARRCMSRARPKRRCHGSTRPSVWPRTIAEIVHVKALWPRSSRPRRRGPGGLPPGAAASARPRQCQSQPGHADGAQTPIRWSRWRCSTRSRPPRVPPDGYAVAAQVLHFAGENERALAYVDKALAAGLHVAEAMLTRATILSDAATSTAPRPSCTRFWRSRKDDAQAYYNRLAVIKRLEPKAERPLLRQARDDSAPASTRSAAYFALYHLYDQAGDHQRAFEMLAGQCAEGRVRPTSTLLARRPTAPGSRQPIRRSSSPSSAARLRPALGRCSSSACRARAPP
jgi:hypothetical protein